MNLSFLTEIFNFVQGNIRENEKNLQIIQDKNLSGKAISKTVYKNAVTLIGFSALNAPMTFVLPGLALILLITSF